MPIQHSKSALMRQSKNEWRKNVQGYTLCPSQKAHSLATSRDCLNKVLVTAPHLSSAPCSPPPPLSHTPKRTKKPPGAQQESQCARRLEERIARKSGLEKNSIYSGIYENNIVKRVYIIAPSVDFDSKIKDNAAYLYINQFIS